MPPKKDKSLKIYYSISEVAEELGLNESAIRHWEKEFDMLRPVKKNGIRKYSHKDIEILRDIHFLVKEQKMKIEGARQQLKRKPKEVNLQAEILQSLQRIKAELLSLKEAFDTVDSRS